MKAIKMTRMPIGVDDFAKAREKYYFVDKTEELGRLLEDLAEVTLITRPRRFGKTLTLSTLRYFLDSEDAEAHRKLFDGLAITKNPAAMVMQGTRPVLFLSLKDWKAKNWEEMQGTIRYYLSELFDQQRYLLNARDISVRGRSVFEQLQKSEAGLPVCRAALKFLLQAMEAYYGRKPVLLIDEYDVPIQSSWEHEYYEDGIDFFRGFLTAALKSNNALDFAVLTGVLRISKESIFSDLNNLRVDSLTASKYPTLIGFTKDEVAVMAADLGHADKMPELARWYDGYRISGYEIYNPWSVVNYFDNDCTPRPYWGNTSGNVILQEMLHEVDTDTMETIQGVLLGQHLVTEVRESFIYSEIYQNPTALYTMLLTTGYLTSEREEAADFGETTNLIIPNREVLNLYRIEVIDRMSGCRLSMGASNLLRAFLAGKTDVVQTGMSQYLENLASFFDTADKESFYHGFLLGMTALLVPDYEVRSNRESGYGRYDVAAFPKEDQPSGIVLEFKVADEGDDLAGKAAEALAQIETKDYLAEFRSRKTPTVYGYGLAFYGKKMQVMCKRF